MAFRHDMHQLCAIMNYEYQVAVSMFRNAAVCQKPRHTEDEDLRILYKAWIWKGNKANKVWRLASQSHIKAHATTQVQYLVSSVILPFYTVLRCSLPAVTAC